MLTTMTNSGEGSTWGPWLGFTDTEVVCVWKTFSGECSWNNTCEGAREAGLRKGRH